MIAKGEHLNRFRTLLQETAAIVPDFPNGDLHVMFTSHGKLFKLGVAPDGMPAPDNVAGLANMGNVCNANYGSRSIVEQGQTSLIRVFLHEVGHNLGMGHNGSYEKNIEGIPKGLCNPIKKPRKGIMRFDPRNTGYADIDNWKVHWFMWSICNRCDLLRNYHKKMINDGKYCLDRA